MAYRDSLRILNKIIQLFSLTKNLNGDQWAMVKDDLLNVIVRDLADLIPNQPLIQIINRKTETIVASSNELASTIRPVDMQINSIFPLAGNELLYIDKPFNTFDEEQKMLLGYIVDHLKTSQEWRKSIEKGFEVQQRLKLLHDITVSIRGSLSLSEVLGKTAQDLGQSLGVSRCFIRRYDPMQPGRVLATEQEYTTSNTMKAADIIFDFETDWMRDLNVQQSDEAFPEYLYIDDVKSLEDPDGLISSLAEEIDLVSFLAVPLLYKGSTLGCICFHQCKGQREFSKSELEFIRQVADEATGAITHAEMYEHIQQEAKTDDLTGLYNKASFHEYLSQEVERARRTNTGLSLMMLDLDFLKTANDTYGHIVGDEMIKLLGLKLKQSLRQIDIIARFGGDEFGVILPDTDLEGAKVLGHRLVQQVLETKHPIAGNLSLSLGISGSPNDELDKDNLIEMADQALYLAKRRGKGRACSSDELEIDKITHQNS